MVNGWIENNRGKFNGINGEFIGFVVKNAIYFGELNSIGIRINGKRYGYQKYYDSEITREAYHDKDGNRISLYEY